MKLSGLSERQQWLEELSGSERHIKTPWAVNEDRKVGWQRRTVALTGMGSA